MQPPSSRLVTQAALAAALATITTSQGVTYTQSTPAAQWSIAHQIPRTPVVSLYGPDGSVMLADIATSAGLVVVTFATPTVGSAVLV